MTIKATRIDAILAVARDLFARFGVEKTSVDEIARLARVAKGTIYNHFGNKEQVYLWVLRREADEILQEISAAVDQQSSSRAKLLIFIETKLQCLRKAVNIFNLDREKIFQFLPRTKLIWEEYLGKELAIVQAVLEEGIKQGVFEIKEPGVVAKAFIYALKGVEIGWLVEEQTQYLDDLQQQARVIIDILFLGMVRQKGDHGIEQ